MSDHQLFTVASTAYLRNLDHEVMDAECIAVHYQNAPSHNPETGSTSYSLQFPTLIIAHYVSEPREIAEKVARILNAYWDAPNVPDQPADAA